VVREHGHEERNNSSKGTRPRSILVDLDARDDPEPTAGGAAQVRAGVREPMVPMLDAPHSLCIAHLPPGAEDGMYLSARCAQSSHVVHRMIDYILDAGEAGCKTTCTQTQTQTEYLGVGKAFNYSSILRFLSCRCFARTG
jgi:hypothetical protein